MSGLIIATTKGLATIQTSAKDGHGFVGSSRLHGKGIAISAFAFWARVHTDARVFYPRLNGGLHALFLFCFVHHHQSLSHLFDVFGGQFFRFHLDQCVCWDFTPCHLTTQFVVLL